MVNLDKLTTEKRNRQTVNIDRLSALEMARMINKQDQMVANKVAKELDSIAKAIELAHATISQGGRVIYFGAGSSGRAGIIDAAEMFPTYGEANWFVAIMAGGNKALITPVEGAEDDASQVIHQLKELNASSKDLLFGISASGRTPYVVSGLMYAKEIGAKSVSLSTAKNAEISGICDVAIEVVTGAETIAGSTRMKSGTAQKLVLNMVSTCTAVLMGKSYSNLLVDMKATNGKLKARAIKMVATLGDTDEATAARVFLKSGEKIKTAVVMLRLGLKAEEADQLLEKVGGRLVRLIG